MGASDYIKDIRSKIGQDFLMQPGVTAIIFNDANEVLLGRRSDTGRWAVIGGGINPDESPSTAAIRETLEETGMTVEIERVSSVYTAPASPIPTVTTRSTSSSRFAAAPLVLRQLAKLTAR